MFDIYVVLFNTFWIVLFPPIFIASCVSPSQLVPVFLCLSRGEDPSSVDLLQVSSDLLQTEGGTTVQDVKPSEATLFA